MVDGAGGDNLMEVIVKALEVDGVLDADAVSRRLLCFGVDGASAFQGNRNGVTQQIQTKVAFFFYVGVHCMAHRCNLTYKSLLELGIFSVIEQSLWKVHHYFCKSPKRLLEYQKLAEVMEMKGLQPLLQVTTRWASLLDPLQRLLAEYQMLLNKLHTDKADNDATEVLFFSLYSFQFLLFVLATMCFWPYLCCSLRVFFSLFIIYSCYSVLLALYVLFFTCYLDGFMQKCVMLLQGPYTVLGMTALMPMLETIDMLVTFSQKRDVYICDFVAALKIYEGELYSLYAHKGIAFASDEFWAFCNLLDCSHEQIHMKWMADLNDNTANLVFVANGDKS